MSNPYIGEIRAFGFHFAPRDWALCNGQLLPVAQFDALFSILGTTYGGDGRTNFAVPNFQDRAPMHWGSGPGLTPRTIGQSFGAAAVTLKTEEIPVHNHVFFAASIGDPSQSVAAPTSEAQLSLANPGKIYSTTPTPAVPFSPKAIGDAGGSQAHCNRQPLLTLNFCISLAGIYPSRT